jgi:membrane associated rhomboid family serine protease
MSTGDEPGNAPGSGPGAGGWGYQVPSVGGPAAGSPPGGWDWGPPPQSGASGSPGSGPYPGPPPVGGAPAAGPPPSLWVRFRQHFDEAPVTVSIVVVTVAVWLVHLALQRWAGINTDLTLGDNGSGIHGDWWRLVTPMVVHFSTLHIGLNMFMLWQLGPPVEKVIGRRLYFASYVACGIAGGILSDLVFGAAALSGGASGAIVGIVGILVGNTAATHWIDLLGRRSTQTWRFNPKVARSLAIQIVIWIVFTSIAIKQIDNWAHIGGGVAGLVIGAAVGWYRSTPAQA